MSELRGWIVKREYGLGWCYDVEKGAKMEDYLDANNFTIGQQVKIIIESESRTKQATLTAKVTEYPNGLDLCYLVDKADPNRALAEAKFEHDERFIAQIKPA